MALGAQAEDVVRMPSRQGMKLVAAGLGVGLAAAWFMTRSLTPLLCGISATDVPTFLVIAASLIPVAWLACYLPARRGLVLSRQICEAHRGTLTLEPRSDRRGAVARLSLPL